MGGGLWAGALLAPWLSGCGGGDLSPIEVVLNEIPVPTEKNLLIGYMLSTWEFEFDGLVLDKIIVVNHDTGEELQRIERTHFPKIYKGDLGTHFGIRFDHLWRYYFSLRLPIPLGRAVPRLIRHCLVFTNGRVVEGGLLSPRVQERPRVIASPLRGERLVFLNQATMDYHFNVAMFRDGNLYTTERYDFDAMQINESLTDFFEGDAGANESYFNYGKPIYSVADGAVVQVENSLLENSGDSADVVLNSMIEYAGNHVIIDIGGGVYACYAHCQTGSIGVRVGDRVQQGDVIARLGNSGNSDAPHLHFQLCDSSDFFWGRGVPFVLESYTKIGEVDGPVTAPQTVNNSMMEETTVFNIEFPEEDRLT